MADFAAPAVAMSAESLRYRKFFPAVCASAQAPLTAAL
jgi:hypothetical protein